MLKWIRVDAPKKGGKEMDRVMLISSVEQVSEYKSIEKEAYIIFYDDGTHMLSQGTVIRNETPSYA